ncbi:MAG TPA: fumarylacetoacetate hydrolase family protein [Thermoleophilaceae bacterium]|nr:fumarylacetoacetate hydrolase family protein [Thermoleophilaceae bacterium]
MTVAFGTAASGRLVARVGDQVVRVPSYSSLDELLTAPRSAWLVTIEEVMALARDEPAPIERVDASTSPLDSPELVLPFTVGDYVDFYSSLEHASFFGRLLRPEGDPLLPNWRRMPVGYHGRAGTVVVSGTPINRPHGQLGPGGFDATRALDIEVELGFVIGGPPNELGEPIPVTDAAERIFGIVLLNDWSARDIQRFESQPLGPFLSKAFATSISAWVVPIAALDHARVRGPRQEPEPLPHLAGGGDWNFDIDLEVELNGERITATNSRGLYWSATQQLAHLASGGAVVRPGDLLGTGTISGGTKENGGSLMEMGRPFLSDGDEIVIRGRAGDVDLGSVSGTILGD